MRWLSRVDLLAVSNISLSLKLSLHTHTPVRADRHGAIVVGDRDLVAKRRATSDRCAAVQVERRNDRLSCVRCHRWSISVMRAREIVSNKANEVTTQKRKQNAAEHTCSWSVKLH